MQFHTILNLFWIYRFAADLRAKRAAHERAMAFGLRLKPSFGVRISNWSIVWVVN